MMFYRTAEANVEFKSFNFIVNFITGEFFDSKFKKTELDDMAPSIGNSTYNFFQYITQYDTHHCYLDDVYLSENIIRTKVERKKTHIKVECVPGAGNKTLQVVTNLKEVMQILSTHGNSTKRTQPGYCSLVLFYTKSCPGSAMVAPHFNAISKQYPDIRMAAIDAFQLNSLNTEFGIVGLPTIMLFHQGRPVIKFNDTSATVNNFIKFITKHTGISPMNNNVFVTSEDFNGPLSNKVERETDYCLYLAWSFIIICAGFYFTKSKLFTQIVEMIQRNWRESEARHEIIN